jgi:hypothetical protein
LAHAYDVMRPAAKTIMLFYTDAPPHTHATKGENWSSERMDLKANKYGEKSQVFIDWVSACKMLRDGEKKAQVFCIIDSHLADTRAPFTMLSTFTGGACLNLDGEANSDKISRVSLGVLLTWMAVEKDGAKSSGNASQLASFHSFKDITGLEAATSEEDDAAKAFFVKRDTPEYCELVKVNLLSESVTLDSLKKVIPARTNPVQDFAKRYQADPDYRILVVDQLDDIIKSDVTAITANPVFGSLWRTVCNDRANPARNSLIEKFGSEVDKISDPDKKARMKAWLEESYDFAGEILAIIESVPEAERFPCVFLDPTLDFKFRAQQPATNGHADAEDDDEGEDEAMTDKFTRAELLEIGRSCEHRILRRLGRVLTRLTYVKSPADLPAHIKAVPESEVPRIPMALVQEKYKRKFWKILLHTVLPGTLITNRPAALLAALSLRIGLKPLQEAADTELLASGAMWNTLDIPETWNTNCLALLLEADKNCRSRAGSEQVKSFLSKDDRLLFETLVDYKLLEMNLDTTLPALIGWKPQKSAVPMGPVAVCKMCKFPRSVTIMAAGSICGLCDPAACDCNEPGAHDAAIQENVSAADGPDTKISWVECSMTTCRAQYVVYRPNKLNVRAKCFYCRQEGQLPKNHPDREKLTSAPCVECVKCKNRIIYPDEYRPAGFDAGKFHCPACEIGMQTIVEEPVTARNLSKANGMGFLLRNDEDTIPEKMLFTGRTLFYTVSNVSDRAKLAACVEILPSSVPPSTHYPSAKPLHNGTQVVASLRDWVARRRVQAGECSLCFQSQSKRGLRAACGRKGCGQQVCTACAGSWYGINAPGRVLNTAALHCPFCRRRPAPGTMTRQVAALGGVADAIRDAGEWVSAWCRRCGYAKRLAMRECAAGGQGGGLEGWSCEECEDAAAAASGTADKRVRIKECPNCKTPTEKMGGCNHIECLVPDCRVHWCWECGETAPEDQIYAHMGTAHGGWYEIGQGDDDEFD